MAEGTLHNQPFLVAEDLSAVGTMSLGVAIPIMAALGVPAAILPTQVLSTQTEGFGRPAKQFSTQWLKETAAHWQNENIQLSGGLIGYVGEVDLLNTLTRMVLEQQLHPLIVDPVMGDDGALYPGLSAEYVAAIRQLAVHADVITPNWTEAHLLAGIPLTDSVPNETDIAAVFASLTAVLGEHTQIVITGILDEDRVKTAYQCHDSLQVISTKLREGHFYGSGDVFSALLAAAIMCGASFENAVKIAVKGDAISLDQTSEAGYQRRFGMQLGRLLAWLSQRVVPKLETMRE
ncbi:pyridoxal kinase [Lactobacillus sp. LC28-10]|uniref:pyridoxal kinase n=1 Tax=Secundilactobacillus angelensis TaxID=2722706 RepID=A0ABX1L1Q1_9LACO|nr:PfkB family carbohydrate kinase [Secundilactobacillus angelensis]MCH5461530.1 bifunctional hydroxymethylpyrimidine kinase/phosphomethylpyrimidine kinase [Secundilactobacillus angelensis]NLR19365.1 pyridoxal kinase [Secundilactobacillus angelensis]